MASISIDIKTQLGVTLFTFDGEADVLSGMKGADKPIWVTQNIPRKQGNIKQFMGTGDGELEIAGVFRGTNEYKIQKKNELRDIALNGTVVVLDTGGFDPSVENKNYVITNVDVPLQGGNVWQFNLVFEEFNN